MLVGREEALMKNTGTITAQDMRASFSSAPCGNFGPGLHHPGHMKCVRLKRNIEARVRQKRYLNRLVTSPVQMTASLITKATRKRRRHKKSGKEFE